jgi:1-phosphofructokinase family hexose kinase
MIITLTLNPSIDITLTTDRILYDHHSSILAEEEHAAGKGINAARVIHSYGGKVHAITTSGGHRGENFRKILDDTGVEHTLISVQGETRRNFAITDQRGLTVKVDQVGAHLHPEEVREIEEVLVAKLPEAEWLLLTGSRPPGVPANFFSRMIQLAADHGVRTLLDSSEESLKLGITAHPNVTKPNRPEAEQLLGRTLLSRTQSMAAVNEIRAMGAERVLLSLADQGVIAAWEEGLIEAVPPSFEAGCPIGAGDVLVATYAWATTQGKSFVDALRWSVAAATAAVRKQGLQFASLDEIEPIRKQVQLHSL